MITQRQATRAAARTRRKGKQAKAGLCCFVSSWLQHDGPSDLSSLWADKAFVFRSPVNVNGSFVLGQLEINGSFA